MKSSETTIKKKPQTRTFTPKRPVLQLDPLNDGVDHINVYSNGRTELGRQLSNLAHMPFVHPRYGKFASVEGFWHWVSTGMEHDILRSLHGLEALRKGRTYPMVMIDNFEEIIKSGIEAKINSYPLLKMGLITKKLPLAHYFVFKGKGDAPDKVVVQEQFRWIVAHLEHFANQLRK